MMSPENNLSKPPPKDDNQSSGSRKTATTTRPPEQGLKCPRCDSPNTKFCYYNNYSLTQPRHFCKTCRRYWTKGGALRNVPIGGGCRKNKKVKTSRLSGDSNDSGSSSELGGFKFFHGLSPPVDFQLRGLTFPRLHHPPLTTGFHNQFPFGEVSATADPSGSSNSITGFNYPFSSTGNGFDGAIQGVSSMNVHSSLASSIESLSSINQDLHWKLQQQRLAALFGGDNENDNGGVSPVNLENHTHKPQPILFENLEITKPGISADGNLRREGTSGDAATEWFFGNSYASVAPTTTTIHENGNGSNWNGVHAWGDHVQQQYSALP